MQIWPSDLDYGMIGFTFDNATGGKLKSIPEDFIVTEVDPTTSRPLPKPPAEMYQHGDDGGLYLAGRVWKRDIDHAKMKRLLAKTFKVAEKDISTAGIKDKKAISTQLFSVYQPKITVSDPLQVVDGLEIDSFRHYREKMYPGRMAGNSFDITVRETSNNTQEILDQFASFAEGGIPNYYGYQRFGGSRPITAELGKLILRGNYRDAIDLYLGGKSASRDEIFRKQWRNEQDPNNLLITWDNIPVIERDILRYLARKPTDFEGAIRYMPEFLINLSFSAYTSLLFNLYISYRGNDFKELSGERKIDDKIHSYSGITRKENIEIAIPSKMWTKPLNDIWGTVFERQEVEMEKDLKKLSHRSRNLILYTSDVEGIVLDDSSYQISFQLPTGGYATTVLRELLQVPPIHLV